MIAGRAFLDDGVFRGIFVSEGFISARSPESGEHPDPVVKAGHLEAEMRGPWMVRPEGIHETDTPNTLEKYSLLLVPPGR